MSVLSGRRKASTQEIAMSILQGKVVDVLPLLRCPRTGSELKPTEDGALVPKNGDRRYPVVDGVPVLIFDEYSLVDINWALESRGDANEPNSPSGFRLLAEQALRRLPTSDRNVAAGRNYRRLVELLRVRAESGRQPRVLVVGGCIESAGSEELLARPELQVIQTDIAFGPRVDVVCDGHDLPFIDGSFDAVVIQAVMDSVVDPPRVASEVHRVLSEDGLVYSEAGFMQQGHLGALDFNRFTHLGHRRLWRFFDEVDSGAQCGPGMAMLWSIEYFLRAFLGESRALGAIVHRVVPLLGFWLKYLDGYLVRRPGGIDAASGTFFLGARRETPVPDRDIVAGFRGIAPRGQRPPGARAEPWEIPGLAAHEEIRASRGTGLSRRERSASGV
jgi:SAM-dependent methyltransferase